MTTESSDEVYTGASPYTHTWSFFYIFWVREMRDDAAGRVIKTASICIVCAMKCVRERVCVMSPISDADARRSANGAQRVKVWDAAKVRRLLETHHSPEVLAAYVAASPIQKADVARYAILATHGGWYFDLDTGIDCQPPKTSESSSSGPWRQGRVSVSLTPPPTTTTRVRDAAFTRLLFSFFTASLLRRCK